MSIKLKLRTWTLCGRRNGGCGEVCKVNGDFVVSSVQVEEIGANEHQIKVFHGIVGSARTNHTCRLLTRHRIRAIEHHDEGQSMGMDRTAEIKGQQSLYRKVQRLVFTPTFQIKLRRINRTCLKVAKLKCTMFLLEEMRLYLYFKKLTQICLSI